MKIPTFKTELKRPSIKRKNNRMEDQIQIMVVEWLNNYHKDLLWWASPNGVKLQSRIDSRTGQRYCPAGNKLKQMGCKSGIQDLIFAEPRGIYHGLFIELKSKTGVASKEQMVQREACIKRGYFSVIMDKPKTVELGFFAVKKVVLDYLALGNNVCYFIGADYARK
jgi:hypothetical protein